MTQLSPARGGRDPHRLALPQADFFQAPIFDCRAALIPAAGKKLTLLIGCSSQKQSSRTKSADLYTSVRFKTARAIAESLKAEYYIISAKHGLLRPDELIAPYDVDLRTMGVGAREAWGEQIAQQLDRVRGQICVLSIPAYSEPIVRHYAGGGKLVAPLTQVDLGHYDGWHEQALVLSRRVEALKGLYQAISRHRKAGATFLLGDLSSRKLPERGVYLFIDRDERNCLGGDGRIVRIGTHAVSEGSKSTLRSRLRNHAGLRDGTGNHRGSIFRLHVGNALLTRENARSSLPTWGHGQDAPSEVRARETAMEQRVSDYLRRLEVLVLDVDDVPSKNSFRATIERQLIALCSENLLPIDKPSRQWLGSSSPMDLIGQSGLWNLRDVGRKYDPTAPGSVKELLSLGRL